MAELVAGAPWWGLGAVIWANVVLSADNVVVMALAARSLPPREKRRALVLGAGAAIAVRIALTVVALEALRLPFLKIVGGLALFGIAVKLLLSSDPTREAVASPSGLGGAVATIVTADLVMSVDNVIAVAAAAQGSMFLLAAGLAISMPLTVFGATVLLSLIERHPMIITLGAAILGWVAGGMLVTDRAVAEWVTSSLPWMRTAFLGATWAEIAGALLVVIAGRWAAIRARPT
jgi:YjbE family integral membrane protein